MQATPSKRPQNIDRELHIGSWLLSQGYAGDALGYLYRAPESINKLINLGICQRQLNHFDDSADCFHRVGSWVLPGEDIWVTLQSARGMLAEDIGLFGMAKTMHEMAYECRPNVPQLALNYAISLLRNGEWEKAWPLWEFGRSPEHAQMPQIPRLKEGNITGGKSILICPEGGYGDLIWLMRYFPMLKEFGLKIHLWTWDSLVPLIEGHPWVDEVIPASKGINLLTQGGFGKPGVGPQLTYDYMLPLMSLPAALNIKEARPIDPYLAVDGHTELRIQKMGYCWKAEELTTARPHRSIPDEVAIKLQVGGFDWHSLVPGEGYGNITIALARDSDWHETAEFLDTLDLVISVDTAIAHLAGAMGIPCWLLLPMRSDWKWGLPDKPFAWYPNMRVFRQTDPVSWDNVIDEVTKALNEL